jgi:hypothetical protein
MISMLTRTARVERSTLESIATPRFGERIGQVLEISASTLDLQGRKMRP